MIEENVQGRNVWRICSWCLQSCNKQLKDLKWESNGQLPEEALALLKTADISKYTYE